EDSVCRRALPCGSGHTMTALSACAGIAALLAAAPSPHLRVTNERILEVMRFAAVRSTTFRALVASIEGSNRIVYVDEGRCGNGNVVSCVQPVARTEYIRVRVDPRGPIAGVVRQLAHEFAH